MIYNEDKFASFHGNKSDNSSDFRHDWKVRPGLVWLRNCCPADVNGLTRPHIPRGPLREERDSVCYSELNDVSLTMVAVDGIDVYTFFHKLGNQ